MLRVGITHTAASTATASTATAAATLQICGRADASEGLGVRPVSSLVATSPEPTPTTIVEARTANSVNQPKVPRISLTHTRAVAPSTISASRAGAPDQPGSSRARTRWAPNASEAARASSSIVPIR